MQWHKFGVHGLLAVALGVAGCGEDGADGAPGEAGPQGPMGTMGTMGDPGMMGDPGDDGRNALIAQTDVGPGADCEFGGVRIDSGVDDDGDGVLGVGEIDATTFLCDPEAAFTLQLLHFADVDGNEAVALESVDEFSALIDGFRRNPAYPNTLVVSSGDNVIPGPRWFAAEDNSVRALVGSNEPGSVDHYFMNKFGVAASALGNHDLDQGPGEFFDSFQVESRGSVTFPGTAFPYLAANVDFTGDEDLSTVIGTDGARAERLNGQVAASATVRFDGGEIVGLVGVSTPQLPSITATGDLEIAGSIADISLLADAVQPAIDALVAEGVNKIVVLAHLQQISFEKALAQELTHVDVIVAGGSNTRMGDATDDLHPADADLEFAENYPFETADADGNPTLIVNVDADYKYLGRLVVDFDADGVVIPNSVDDEVSGAWASTTLNAARAGGQPILDVVAVRDAVQAVITEQYENVIGHTDVFLEGRRQFVRTQETNLGNLTADSMKWYVERCDQITSALALKNGGGIRAEIGNLVVTGDVSETFPPFNDGLDVDPGDVSEGHLRGTLRFDNGLVVLDVTGSELKVLLEHAVAATGPGSVPGQFPQVGGMWFGYDPDGTAQVLDVDGDGDIVGIATQGTRVTDLYVDTNADGIPDTAIYVDGVAEAAASDTFQVVTLNFLANGGDDYPFVLLSAPNRFNAYAGAGFGESVDYPDLTNCDPGFQSMFSYTGGEQDALSEYMLAFYPDPGGAFDIAETDPADDRRIQDLNVITAFVAP